MGLRAEADAEEFERITDQLIELTPGQNPLYASVPPLPIFSPAPSLRSSGMASDRASEFAQELIFGTRRRSSNSPVEAAPKLSKPDTFLLQRLQAACFCMSGISGNTSPSRQWKSCTSRELSLMRWHYLFVFIVREVDPCVRCLE